MSDRIKKKIEARLRRKRRVRAKISGTADRPRLSVYRSLGHIYAQLIDDAAGRTLAAASDLQLAAKDLAALKKGDKTRRAKTAVAFAVGGLLAAKAGKKGIVAAVFDRGGFAYAGRAAALADGARQGGLKF